MGCRDGNGNNDSRFPPEAAHVDAVFFAPRGRLVPDEIFVAERRHPDALQLDFETLGPGVCERHTVDAGEDVDAARRQSELDDHVRTHEIVLAHCEIVERSTEVCESNPDTARVLGRAIDPDINVDGRSRQAVRRQSMSAYNKKADAFGNQRREDVVVIPIGLVAHSVLFRERPHTRRHSTRP